jgi:hypothetical protein
MLRKPLAIAVALLATLLHVADAWECPCGRYCPVSYKNQIVCPVGSYCLKSGYNKTTLPYNCTPGRLCDEPGLCAAKPCPCGFYCPRGSTAPILCRAGTYCPASSSREIRCTTGDRRCSRPGQCSKDAPQTTTPALKCPEPTCDPLNIPPELQGYICLNDPPDLCGLFCVDETYCPGTSILVTPFKTTQTNQVARTTTRAAPVYDCGFYVLPGTAIQVPCRARYYCPSGPTPSTPIVPVICPGGYACDTATCTPKPCECGTKCPEGSAVPIVCQPPYYCPSPLATSMTLCPIGFKCDAPGMCNATACPPGTFVTCAGKITCDTCPAGRYCPNVTSTVLCTEGYFCPPGASAPALCPAGSYCPLGTSAPIACPVGTWSDAGSKSRSKCVFGNQTGLGRSQVRV